jgi:hypothetical protein
MPFNTLILSCLLSRDTSFSEKGARVSVTPLSGETILFFVIDENSNERSNFRNDLDINGKVCDLLVLFAKRDCENKILCFVELKSGDDFKKGTNQIIDTYNSLKAHFSREHLQKIKFKGYVFARTMGSPQDTKKWRAKLQGAFGKKNGWIDEKEDIGYFLRN